MKRNVSKEKSNSEQDLSKQRGRLRMGIAKTALSAMSLFPTAAVAALPAAEFFGVADAAVVKVYSEANQHLHTDSPIANTTIDNTLAAAMGMSESVAMGLALTNNKRLKNAYELMDKSYEAKRAKRSKFANAAILVAKSPLKALERVGDGIRSLGEKAENRNSKIARDLGRLVVDFGSTTAITSTGVIADETFHDNPPSTRRTVRLSVLGTSAALGLIEGAREIYEKVPALRGPMNGVAKVFDVLTNLDLHRPWATPIALGAFTLAAAGLGTTGFNIARYGQEQQSAGMNPELQQPPIEENPEL